MIYFTGDINLTDWYFNHGFGIGTNIAKGLDPYKHLNRKEGDLWVGNFEGVTSSVSINKGMNGEVFRVEPEVMKKLDHFDVYGFANNHAMQHGAEAYRQTVDTLEGLGCKVIGTNQQKSTVCEHNGKKISITGVCLRIDEFSEAPSYWHNPEYREIETEINSLPEDAFKVLYIHWGNEYINRPSAGQKKFAHWLIDAGFDLIIGMHPHVMQGYEEYNGKHIFYSLGNFVFDMASEPCKIGALVGLDFEEGKPMVSEEYIRIDDECCPHVVSEKEIPRVWQFDYLNEQLKKEDNSEQYHHEIERGYNAYRKANHRYILNNMIHHPKAGVEMIIDFVKRRL